MRLGALLSLSALLALASASFAAPSAQSTPGLKRLMHAGTSSSKEWKRPKLYNGESDEVQEVSTGPLLPHRVYAVYDEKSRQWYFALTNAQGRFPEPAEYLSFGSVLLGAYLGRHDGASHFRFDNNWKWEPTDRAERRILWVQSDPQEIRKEFYLKWTDPSVVLQGQ